MERFLIKLMSLLYLSICFNLLACSTKNNNAEVVSEDTTFVTEAENASIQSIPPVQWVLTAKEQANLSPEEVIKVLKEGNERFVSNDLTARDHSAQVRKSADAQFPKAIVLSCVDSRIPVEDVFDRGIGDIFVARVAGNFINDDILGSMEFACKVSGAKLIVVMGHENCGAIQAAIDGVKLGNITSMLKNIKPAIALTQYEGDRNSANPEFVHLVCENNVRNSMKEILKRSPILTEMVTLGEIKVVGAIYDMDSGQAAFLED